MKTRVLIFSIAYEPLIGGAELAVRNITDRLFDYEFDLITARFSRRHPGHERIGNVNVYRVGFGNRLGRYLYPMLAFRLARKLHQRNPYQIIWSVMAAYAGAAALMFLRRFPTTRYLLTLQEGDPIVHIHRRVRGMRKIWQRIFRRADYVQAISQYLADWARAEGAKCPVEVVPNGVDLNSIMKHEARITDKEKFVIITTSRLVHKNGIDILIRAAAELKTLISNSRFIIQILGTGRDEDKLKRLANEIGVSDVVEFIGNIEPAAVSEFLAQADIFVRSSRSEGLGSAFLEAMAAGLPVIGTPVGGIPDFLTPLSFPTHEGGKEEGSNGLFVKVDDPQDLADKIKFLIDNPEARKTLGENGQKLVSEKYDWNKIALRFDRIIRHLTLS